MIFLILLLLVVIKFMKVVNMAKNKQPFDRSLSRYKFPLELLRSDLMGPTQTLSYSGSHYMLLSIDDFTRFTWVYFVKEKSKVLSKFQEFKLIIESARQRKIKRLCIDNGGEFTSDKFFSFYKEYDIKRKLTW
ncbi:unnamed protein product [Musa acuminata subsp. burmannicoides]